jgi:hypothetical protein
MRLAVVATVALEESSMTYSTVCNDKMGEDGGGWIEDMK